MNKIVSLSDYRDTVNGGAWSEIASFDNECSTLSIHANASDGSVDVTQYNDDGKAIRTVLSKSDLITLVKALANVLKLQAG